MPCSVSMRDERGSLLEGRVYEAQVGVVLRLGMLHMDMVTITIISTGSVHPRENLMTPIKKII
jgi:hypothetical protein